MRLEQFQVESLGQASYLIGSETADEARVFDPQRDVSDYFAEARSSWELLGSGLEQAGGDRRPVARPADHGNRLSASRDVVHATRHLATGEECRVRQSATPS